MKKLLLISASLFLASCSLNQAKPGDGREWAEVSCSGFADWTKCNAKAAKLCPNGYDVANREESLIAQRRTMMVACTK
ncbi:MAG TPA: hypothetical protein VFF74_02790 [Methylophilaceae bacterium]|nr:hypothetical protein [Methylophilaceae bacterium]